MGHEQGDLRVYCHETGRRGGLSISVYLRVAVFKYAYNTRISPLN